MSRAAVEADGPDGSRGNWPRLNERKREKLISAGADIIVPDFTCGRELVEYLFCGG